MKKQYEKPKAEKLEFDYVESVVACCSRAPWCEHVFLKNQGAINPPPAPKSTIGEIYNSDPNGQYYKCGCQPKTSYYN